MDKNIIQPHSKMTNDPRTDLLSPMEFPGLVVRKAAEVAVTLQRRPSFDPEATWTLYRDGSQWYVRRIICAFNDGPLAGKLGPDTYGSETAFPNVEAERILAALCQLAVRPFPNPGRGIVLDGCKYEIVWGGMTTSIHLQWWCEAPSEWSELRDWYANAVAVFQTHLPEPTTPIQAMHPWCE